MRRSCGTRKVFAFLTDYAVVDRISNHLKNAEEAYDKIASCLRPVWEYFSSAGPAQEEILTKLAGDIRAVKSYEEAGIQQPKDFLRTTS